jgi:hypothetical protein
VPRAGKRDDEGETMDVMDKLNLLAEDLRKREPSLTREQAFTKVYTAPEKLRKAERNANGFVEYPVARTVNGADRGA